MSDRPCTNNHVRLIVCGDSACGKSTFLHRFIHDEYKEAGILGAWSDHKTEFRLGEQTIQLELIDCSGAEGYTARRKQGCTDEPITVVLFCYAVDDHRSFSSVDNKWLEEFRRYDWFNHSIKLVVGLKSDFDCRV